MEEFNLNVDAAVRLVGMAEEELEAFSSFVPGANVKDFKRYDSLDLIPAKDKTTARAILFLLPDVPDEDVRDFMRMLRTNKRRVPVVLISKRMEAEHMSMMLRVGIKTFLFPPIGVSNIVEVITYSQTAPDLDPSLFESDDINLTFSRYMLTSLNLAAKAQSRLLQKDGSDEEYQRYMCAFKHSLQLAKNLGGESEEELRDKIVDLLVKRVTSEDTKIYQTRKKLKAQRELARLKQ